MSMDNKVWQKARINLTAEYAPAVSPLKDVSRRTEKFLAMLGHEMRNPLSALSYALDVWEQTRADPVQMEELRHVIQRQVSQLMRISDDLLDAERISQGKLTLRQERVELQQLVNGACEQVRPFIDRCGHALTVAMSADAIVVYGDSSRLLQVFANLLQNAAKFYPPQWQPVHHRRDTGRHGRSAGV